MKTTCTNCNKEFGLEELPKCPFCGHIIEDIGQRIAESEYEYDQLINEVNERNDPRNKKNAV